MEPEIRKGQIWEEKGESVNKIKVVSKHGNMITVMDIHGDDYGAFSKYPKYEFTKKFRLIKNA
jgi:hypothetical protein